MGAVRHTAGVCTRSRPAGSDVLSLRAASNGVGVLVGHFAVFNQWTEIVSLTEGRFLEQIAPTAFDEAFKDATGIRCLFDHGQDPFIGSKPLGVPTVLRVDKVGAYYEVPLFDTQYVRELRPAMAARQLGASFRFSVPAGGDLWHEHPGVSAHNPKGLPERTVRALKLYEFGPVVFGAYAAATVGLRGDPQALRREIARLRTAGARPARLGVPRRPGSPRPVPVTRANLAVEIAKLRAAS